MSQWKLRVGQALMVVMLLAEVACVALLLRSVASFRW